jgi:multicomponent Na+:H+ antiporter subunit E
MKLLRKTIAFAAFIPYYAWEILCSNFRVAYDILTPRDHFSPAIVGIPIKPMTDTQLLMFGNLISMTPGTLTLDISEDRTMIYIHAMYATDVEKLVRNIHEDFEPRIRDAF